MKMDSGEVKVCRVCCSSPRRLRGPKIITASSNSQLQLRKMRMVKVNMLQSDPADAPVAPVPELSFHIFNFA